MKVQASTALSCFVLLLTGCSRPMEDRSTGATERQPNLILIVVDALRRDHLGIYGYDKPTSPGMDSMAAEGIVFENAYSHGSQTFNSTASLLTSRYFPHLLPRSRSEAIAELDLETAARHSRVPVLAESNTTLAEVLRQGGYQTLGIFTNPHHHSSSGFWQGFDDPRYLSPEKGGIAYARGPKIHAAFFDWYDDRRANRPFFAYLHFMDVHNPYRPPKFLRKQFVTVKGRDLYRKGVPSGDRVPTDTDLQYMMALYDAEIRFVDLVVEGLRQGLEEREGLEDTVFILTSDHGDEFMDHGGLGHGSHLERELIHVPLVIVGPGIEARREAELSRHIDVAPTVAEIAGLKTPATFEGHSLLAPVKNPDQVSPGAEQSFAAVADLRSLTTREWHFTFNPQGGEKRLYRLASDPRGLQDLSADHLEITEEFLERLEQLDKLKALSTREALEAAALSPGSDEDSVDAEIQEQLEALGYVDQH